MDSLLERFLRYVKIDTQSEEDCEMVPSTKKQFVLAEMLYNELIDMGLSNVFFDKEHCYVYAEIPSNMTLKGTLATPVIGFIAHMDTSPEISGKDVNPCILQDYNGEDILLNSDKDIWLTTDEFPELKNYKGKTLIVTDGCTLLGADDKAGVAEIMTMASILMSDNTIPHGTVKIAFTPDEEVGRGVDYFDVNKFGASFAYTIDGGKEGEIEFENFNAASAKVKIHGKSIHPGDAKNRMVNACLLASQFMQQFPAEQTPEHTEKYEGFYHVNSVNADIENAEIHYIIRDHNRNLFEQKKAYFYAVCDFMNERYGEGTFEVNITDSYYNMKEKIMPVYHIIETAVKAMENAGVTPEIVPIRGGTDGARLSFMGIPCPNIYTGGHNFHGRFEYACLDSMESVVNVMCNIVSLYAYR